MSNLGTLTGRDGKFQVGTVQVARTTIWAVSPKLASTSEWGDSDSAGYTNRAPGRKDATFTAEGKYDLATEIWDIFMPGDNAKSVLWLTPGSSSPFPAINPLFWDFPSALCSDFQLSVNIDTEEVIGWTSSWGADGLFYYPGQPANRNYAGQPAAPVETLPSAPAL